MNFSPITSRPSYGNISNNGVSGFNNYSDPSFEKIEEIKMRNRNKFSTPNEETALKGVFKSVTSNNDIADNGLSRLFFSSENMKRIQKQIKQEIYLRTKKQFRLDDNQDESDLLVAMRAVYMEHCRFLPNQIVRQIKDLNKKVVNEVVPDMITSMMQSYAYLKEINSPREIMPQPLNVSNHGRKLLKPLTSVYGF